MKDLNSAPGRLVDAAFHISAFLRETGRESTTIPQSTFRIPH